MKTATTSPRSFATGWSPVCEVDDREAPVAEHAAAVGRDGAVIGAAMYDRRVHALDQPRVGRVPAEESADPAHARYARLRGRVVPRRTAARRPGLGALPRPAASARPGGFRDRVADAAAGRRRGRGAVRRARPRGGGARAVRAPHALDVADPRAPDRRRSRPSACCARARWLREQGLEPRFFCGGGWYTDAGVIARGRRARLRRLHRDRLAAVVPAAGVAARRARPARVGPARRRPPRARAADDALARRGRALARAARCRRSSTSTSTTTSCSTPKRRARAARRRCALLARRRRAGRARRARGRARGRRGPTYAPTDGARGARRARSPAAARRPPTHGHLGPGRREPVPHHRSSATARRWSREDEDARLRYQLASSGDQHTLTKVTSSSSRRTSTRSRPTSRAARRRSRSPHAASGVRHLGARCIPATDVQQVYDAFEARPGRPLPRRRRARRPRRPARPDPPDQGRRRRARTRRSRSSRARPAGACASPTATSPALAFPGSPGGTRLPARRPARRARFPRARRPRRGLRHWARASTRTSTSATFAQTLAALRGATRAAARVPPPSELALIKWRDVRSTGPAAGARGRDALPGGRDPARLGAARQPVGDLQRHARRSTATRIPDPAGLIRQVHARGVRFMLWVSPKATCDAGLSAGARARPTRRASALDLRQPAVVAEYQARLRKLVALGVDGVKADRGDEVDLESVEPDARRTTTRCSTRSAVIGALPPGAGAIFRPATIGLAGTCCRGSGPATSPATFDRPAARDPSPAQTAGDERLPDLGLGRRRLLGRGA